LVLREKGEDFLQTSAFFFEAHADMDLDTAIGFMLKGQRAAPEELALESIHIDKQDIGESICKTQFVKSDSFYPLDGPIMEAILVRRHPLTPRREATARFRESGIDDTNLFHPAARTVAEGLIWRFSRAFGTASLQSCSVAIGTAVEFIRDSPNEY
jgi:hypothetical protein